MADVEFKYVNAELYRYPGEREARERLEKIPGFRKAVDALVDYSGIDAGRQAEVASMVRVGPGAYPALHEMWTNLQRSFGLHGIPLHIAWELPHPCELRGGNDYPAVILGGRLLDALPEREMSALLAMQAGSVRLGNAALIAACDFSRWFLDFYGIAGAPAALPAWGLENWRRYAMFSADRAAALVHGDSEAVAALLCRFAGAGSTNWGGVTSPEDLRLQGVEARSLQVDWSNSRLRRFALAMNRQNSAALIRRADLLDWFASGVPARILSGEMTDPAAERDSRAAGSEENREKDPFLAYWGEFAGQSASGESGRDAVGSALGELRDIAEKGVGSFFKAGEAFWKTLRDESGKK